MNKTFCDLCGKEIKSGDEFYLKDGTIRAEYFDKSSLAGDEKAYARVKDVPPDVTVELTMKTIGDVDCCCDCAIGLIATKYGYERKMVNGGNSPLGVDDEGKELKLKG